MSTPASKVGDKTVESATTGTNQTGRNAAAAPTSNSNVAATTAAVDARGADHKTQIEAHSLEALIKRLLVVANEPAAAPQKFKWDSMMTDVGVLAMADGQSYHGTFYKTEANQGKMVLRMENGRTSKPGTLKIGVKSNDNSTEILTLAKIHKTRGHDFYIKNLKTTSKPSIQYGVVKVPNGYDNAAPNYLGFPNVAENPAVVSLNCDADDTWIDPDDNVLERSHSPAPF